MIRKKIVILILTLFIVFISLFLFLNYNSEDTNKDQKLEVKQAEELSEKEFEKIKEDYISLLNKENPKIVLNRLLEHTSTNSALLRSCHSLAHYLGHAAYEKYQNFAEALKYQDEICNSGYLHGVIESHFALSTNISDTIQAVCDKYNVKSFTGWQCYHGVGHGLMFFNNNDLPKSIAICETYKNGLAKSSCVNGVFMENFNTDQKLHSSRFLKTEDPLYPCKEQSEENKKDCYVYAPVYYLTLKNNNYLDALSWCKTAEKEYVSVCLSGVGSQAIKENINNPKFVEKICMSADKEYVSSCISGMVILYINHFGSTKKAQELCGKLEKENMNTCQKDVDFIKKTFSI